MREACTFVSDRQGARTVIRLAGTFDRSSAIELGARLHGVPDGELVLDFSRVSEFGELGVATLGLELAGADRRLLMLGLRQHQVRILRYFGVDVEALRADDGGGLTL